MTLSTAQLQALKAAILAETDPVVTAALAAGAMGRIAAFYNEQASPAWTVWRTSVSVAEYRRKIVYTECDALQVGKARIWEWLTGSMTLAIDPSDPNIRQGLADCWASNTTTRAQLLALGKRTATRAEKLFSTGTGSDADPATMGWEGVLPYTDVIAALGS